MGLSGFTVGVAGCLIRFPGFTVGVCERFTGQNVFVACVTCQVAVFRVVGIGLNLSRWLTAIAVRYLASFLGFAISVAGDSASSSAFSV